MTRITALLAATMLLFLQSCTVGPDYERPEPDMPDTWLFTPQTAEETANTSWWEQFNDPVLNNLIRTALLGNRDIRVAAARVEQFMARLDQARSGHYPQLGYGAAGSRDQASKNLLPPGVDSLSSTFSATVNVGWELDIWGRIRRANEAARANLLAAEQGRRAVILSLVSSVATSYITLRTLDKQLEISKRTLQSRKGSLDLFEKKFNGGVISLLTLAQIRSEYEQAAVAIPTIELQREQVQNALSVLLGSNPGSVPRGRAIDEIPQIPIPAGIPSDILTRRPDIVQAEQNLIAANALIGVARAEYFPTISLTGLAGLASGDLADLVHGDSFLWSLGGNATGAIFSGGRITAGVRLSEAYYRELLASYQQAILTALREVEDALAATARSRERLEAEKRRVTALADYARLARMRYDNGYASYIEVLDAERSLFDAELNVVKTEETILTNLIRAYKAMGGGWVGVAENTADTVDFPEPDTSRNTSHTHP